MRLSPLQLSIGAFASAAGATTVTDNAAFASNKTFDFVIAGAGLSGITVANKLSGQGHSVLLVEAGPDGSWNPAIWDVERSVYPAVFCNWNYPVYDDAGNKLNSTIDAGACIGGSTSINGMVWYRPTKAEIDKLETLGNPGWNWDNLEPYMKAIERNHPPTADQVAQGAGYDPEVHGYHGQVNTSFPTPMRIPKAVQLYKKGLPLVFTGLEVGNDLSNRTSVVSASTSWTIWNDPVTGKHVRSSAADALLWAPDQQRTALTVLANHTVAKVTFDKDLQATGVLFASSLTRDAGKLYTVKARKSVILSAGTLATPAILERSGVGRASVLSAANVAQLIDLPGVGVNLNDQPGSTTYAHMSENHQNDTSLVDGGKLFGPEISLVNIDEIWATVPVAEFIAETYPAVFGAPFWPLMPLSRGHVHIRSEDPFEVPVITPRFLTDQFDQQVAVAVARLSRALWASTAFEGFVDDAYYDPEIGPNGTDAEYLAWLKGTAGPASHWIGSTAMMPRHLGGVVDSRLRVYGAKNLRVVDAGILPFQLTSHTMSTLYAVAQKAAQLILEDCN
ncbi:GMC oxidoreductase [Metarhizium anisopliae]|nr:GMC oxidoreductase [Metarhizium anisopliae]